MLKLLPQRDKREPKPNADAPNNPQTTRPAEEHDEPGNELGKGARVWRVYVQETEQADKEMCDDWDKSLDVMLIFAALFSAISTAFIIESMKKLQPDPADTSASTLLDISRTLAAISNNQPVLMPPLPDPASKTFTPSRASILVNMLWLTSLIISVGVSLMAMLAKKWCHRFLSARSGPYHEQARRRQKRWDSILAWRMQGVMDGLPLLMHLALALFATGLLVYLWDINQQVAAPVVAITSVFVILYAAATFLPVMFDSCPYGTAVSDSLKLYIIPATPWILAALASPVVYLLHLVTLIPLMLVSQMGWARLDSWERLHVDVSTAVCEYLWKIITDKFRGEQNDKSTGDEIIMDTVTSSILGWLITNSEDRDHVRIALQAISGATIELPMRPLRGSGIKEQLSSHMMGIFSGSWDQGDVRLRADADLRMAGLHAKIVVEGCILERFRQYIDHSPAYHFSISLKPLDSTHSPDDFVLNASAIMALCNLRFYLAPQSEVSIFIDRIAADILAVTRSHIDKDIKLGDQSISAVSAGCAQYLVWKISRGNIDDIVQKLIIALLRIYLAPEELPRTVKYTIAVALASSAAAAAPVHPQYEFHMIDIMRRYNLPSVRLFQEHIHPGTESLKGGRSSFEDLFAFGVIGILPILPLNSCNTEDIDLIREGCGPLLKQYIETSTSIRGLAGLINYKKLMRYTALKLLRLINDAGKSVSTERTILSWLQAIPRECDRNFFDTPVGPAIVSGLCHARSEELWDRGSDLLNLTAKNVSAFDDSSLESLSRYDLLRHLFDVSIASDSLVSPQAMRRLWRVVQLILASTNSTRTRRYRALQSLLQRDEFVDTMYSGRILDMSCSIDDLRLGHIWLEQLQPMVSSGPVLDMDGSIIDVMVEHYGKEVPAGQSPEGSSESNDRIELLNKWQNLNNIYRTRKMAQERWAKLRGMLQAIRGLPHGQSERNSLNNEVILSEAPDAGPSRLAVPT